MKLGRIICFFIGHKTAWFDKKGGICDWYCKYCKRWDWELK